MNSVINKDKLIDEFFDSFIENCKRGTRHLDWMEIYQFLTFFGVKDRILSCKQFFSSWIERYGDKKNIEVFEDDQHHYFCRFENNAHQIEYIKIYVPLDYDHMQKGVMLLFDFLEKNNIKHTSKVASNIRFDDVVVRVTNIVDAEAVINFIQSNNYIQEGLIQQNPFAFNEDGVSFACDGRHSYNYVVSDLIYLYLSNNMNDNVENIDAQHFYEFVQKLYEDMFINRTKGNNVNANFREASDVSEFNLRNIIELVLKSHEVNFTLGSYFQHFINSQMYYYYDMGIIDPSNKTDSVLVDGDIYTGVLSHKAIENMIFEYMMLVSNKFGGNIQEARKYFKLYVSTGHTNFVPSQNDLHLIFYDIDFRNQVLCYLNDEQIDLDSLLDRIVSTMNLKNDFVSEIQR